jgi:hypothetical protein
LHGFPEIGDLPRLEGELPEATGWVELGVDEKVRLLKREPHRK